MPTTSLLRPTLLVLAFGLFLLVFVPACGPNKPVDEPVTAGPVTPPAPAVTRLAAEEDRVVVAAPGLSKSDIVATLGAARPEIRACYEAALKKSPKLEGSVEVSFEIEKSGKVLNAAIASTELKNKTTEKCLKKLIGGLVFPAHDAEGTIKVKYPLSFSPADPEPSDTVRELAYDDEAVAPSSAKRGSDAIRAVMVAQRPALTACYEKELATAPELAGKLVLAISIDKDGKVTETKVTENGLNDAVASCVSTTVAAAPFPAGDGELMVRYPLVFESPNDRVDAATPVDLAAVVTPVADKSAIKAVFSDHRQELASCYDAARTVNPKVAGKLVLALTIASDGAVQEALVSENATGDEELGRCIVACAQAWSFPASKSGILKISYPLQFAAD